MKIGNVSEDGVAKIGILDKENKHSANRVQPSFGEQLQRVHGDIVHQELEAIFNDVQKQGKILSDKLNINELKKYKDLVQKFLDHAVNKMYHLKEQYGRDRRGRYKTYTLIETVNKQLESLTNMLMSEQKDQIAILSKIDEIRGILVDIYS